MSKSSATVQQWIDTLPPNSAAPAGVNKVPVPKNPRKFLTRDPSLQSDDGSSHCSSVESVLELRKPDPEAVLLELGFGPPKNSSVSRIPKRFLKPSKLLSQIDLNKFLEQYSQSKYPEQSSTQASPVKSQTKT